MKKAKLHPHQHEAGFESQSVSSFGWYRTEKPQPDLHVSSHQNQTTMSLETKPPKIFSKEESIILSSNIGQLNASRRTRNQIPPIISPKTLEEGFGPFLILVGLHKYCILFENFKSYEQLYEMDDGSLEMLGVNTKGARVKFIKVFDQMKRDLGFGCHLDFFMFVGDSRPRINCYRITQSETLNSTELGNLQIKLLDSKRKVIDIEKKVNELKDRITRDELTFEQNVNVQYSVIEHFERKIDECYRFIESYQRDLKSFNLDLERSKRPLPLRIILDESRVELIKLEEELIKAKKRHSDVSLNFAYAGAFNEGRIDWKAEKERKERLDEIKSNKAEIVIAAEKGQTETDKLEEERIAILQKEKVSERSNNTMDTESLRNRMQFYGFYRNSLLGNEVAYKDLPSLGAAITSNKVFQAESEGAMDSNEHTAKRLNFDHFLSPDENPDEFLSRDAANFREKKLSTNANREGDYGEIIEDGNFSNQKLSLFRQNAKRFRQNIESKKLVTPSSKVGDTKEELYNRNLFLDDPQAQTQMFFDSIAYPQKLDHGAGKHAPAIGPVYYPLFHSQQIQSALQQQQNCNQTQFSSPLFDLDGRGFLFY